MVAEYTDPEIECPAGQTYHQGFGCVPSGDFNSHEPQQQPTPPQCPDGHEVVYLGLNEQGQPHWTCKAPASTWDTQPNDATPNNNTANQTIPAPPSLTSSIPAPGPLENSYELSIFNNIMSTLNGKNLPFGPDQINAIRARIFGDTTGRAKAAKSSADRDAIRRGIFRSGIASENAADIDRAASADYSTNVRETVIQAAKENYAAKAQKLQMAAQQLENYRNYRLNSVRTQNEFRIASAQIDLAYARLNQQWRELQAQLQNALTLASMGHESALTLALLNLQNSGGSPYYR